MSARKLNRGDVEAIRVFRDTYNYSQRELAEIFDVSRATIRRVLSGEAHRPTNRPVIYPASKVTSNHTADELLEGENITLETEDLGINWPMWAYDRHRDDIVHPDEDTPEWLFFLILVILVVAVAGILLHTYGFLPW